MLAEEAPLDNRGHPQTMGKKKASLKSLSNFQSTAQPLLSNRTVKQQVVDNKAPVNTVSKPAHKPHPSKTSG